jgi:hypothetical protein
VGHVAHMGEERNRTRFGEKARRKDHLEDRGIDGRTGSEWILRILDWGGELILLAQDRGRWWALVNVVMNLWVLVSRN